jgi:hypothetical protein
VLASYTYSHSLDNVSSDVASNPSAEQFKLNPRANYGDSDFDIRHTASLAVDYEVMHRWDRHWVGSLFGGWGINTLLIARTAPPIDVVLDENIGSGFFIFRPNGVAGAPVYVSDPNAGGGTRINPDAFAAPTAPGQGDLRRNVVRGFGLFQQDISVRRSFRLSERVRLQARVEAFNIFNHPNFASQRNLLGFLIGGNLIPRNGFGISQSMLGTGLRGGGFGSGFNPLYQVGGPRSMQLALKIEF